MSSFAHAEKATQLVLGASRRSRFHELLHGSFAGRVMRAADELDVHVIADHDDANRQASSAVAPCRRRHRRSATDRLGADDCRVCRC